MSPEFELEPLTKFSLYQSPALETRVLLLFLALEKKIGKWVTGDCGTHRTVYGKTVNQSMYLLSRSKATMSLFACLFVLNHRTEKA